MRGSALQQVRRRSCVRAVDEQPDQSRRHAPDSAEGLDRHHAVIKAALGACARRWALGFTDRGIRANMPDPGVPKPRPSMGWTSRLAHLAASSGPRSFRGWRCPRLRCEQLRLRYQPLRRRREHGFTMIAAAFLDGGKRAASHWLTPRPREARIFMIVPPPHICLRGTPASPKVCP